MAQKDYQKFGTLSAFMRFTGIKRSRAEKLFIYGHDPIDEKEYKALLSWQEKWLDAARYVVKKPK